MDLDRLDGIPPAGAGAPTVIAPLFNKFEKPLLNGKP
jgi:hypothetical protein